MIQPAATKGWLRTRGELEDAVSFQRRADGPGSGPVRRRHGSRTEPEACRRPSELERPVAIDEHRELEPRGARVRRSSKTFGGSARSARSRAASATSKKGRFLICRRRVAKRDENRAGWPKSDPEASCYLPGIPRATYMPYPFQIVQGDGDILFSYAFANANRAIHMTDIRSPIKCRSICGWAGRTANGTATRSWSK